MQKAFKLHLPGIMRIRAIVSNKISVDFEIILCLVLYTYIVEQEREFHSNHKSLGETQTDISVNDRTTLMTWLIRICTSNHFQSMHLVIACFFLSNELISIQEALHLCVAIIDDYLSRTTVVKDKFQLVGVTALLLASKQLIYDPPDIQSLVQLCECIYNADDIKTCEEQMLKVLNWALHRPTGHTFVDFFAGRLLYQNPTSLRCSTGTKQYEKRIIRHLVRWLMASTQSINLTL